MRQAGLPFQVVCDAYVNLLPSDQFEEQETTIDKGVQGQEKVESTRTKRKGKKHDTEKCHEYDDSSESDKEPDTEQSDRRRITNNPIPTE